MVIRVKGMTAGRLRERDEHRLAFLRTKLDVHIHWECDICQQLKENPQMQKFFNTAIDTSPIKIRDCFFGGRTEAIRLHLKAAEGETIKYLDFNSLYPYTNFITSYPIGHSRCIDFDDDSSRQTWTQASHNPYTGLLKVLIEPPQVGSLQNHILTPLLPAKFDERLLFQHCRTCSKQYPKGSRLTNYRCDHSPEERSFVAQLTSLELNCALDVGWVVHRVLCVLQYDHWDNNLFKGYVREMLKLKIESTGWKKLSVGNESDVEPSCVEKREFIEDCWKRFQIRIDEQAVDDRPGLRLLSKLMANSLWATISLLNDRTLEISAVDMINDQVIMVSYTKNEEFVEENASSNPVISAWSTAAARMLLYRALCQVESTPGACVGYMDTDSIIYKYRTADGNPLQIGKHLGEMTDEYPNHTIEEVVSVGCKQYAMKMKHNDTGIIEHTLKIRGLPMDWETTQSLSYNTFKEKVLSSNSQQQPQQLKYNQIRGDKFGGVYTLHTTKTYAPVTQKGIINKELVVLPFGYS